MMKEEIARHKEYLDALVGRVGKPAAMAIRATGEMVWLMGKSVQTFAVSEAHAKEMNQFFEIGASILDGMLCSTIPGMMGRSGMDEEMKDMLLREVKLIIDRMDGGEMAVILMPKMAWYEKDERK